MCKTREDCSEVDCCAEAEGLGTEEERCWVGPSAEPSTQRSSVPLEPWQEAEGFKAAVSLVTGTVRELPDPRDIQASNPSGPFSWQSCKRGFMIDLAYIQYFFSICIFFPLQQVMSVSSFIFGLFSLKGVLYPLFWFHIFSRVSPDLREVKSSSTAVL